MTAVIVSDTRGWSNGLKSGFCWIFCSTRRKTMARLFADLAVTLVALAFASAASAQVINGCIKTNGTLKIVTGPADCSARETPISWNQQGPQGEPGPAGEPGLPGEPGAEAEVLHVFDNNGVDVGIYAGADAVFSVEGKPWHYRVYLPDSEVMLFVRALDGVQSLQDVWYYFESTDCTGDAYARQAGRLIRPAVYDLYIATGTEPVAIQTRSKSWRTPLPEPYNCASGGVGTMNVFSATVIDPAADLGLSFPLPAPLAVAPAP
jgi:hypothetical protein